MSAHRVVIIGGGFGGVRAARALERAPVQTTLIDRTNHHLFQPLLYQVATGVLSAGQIAPALRSLFRHQQNVSVMLGEVQDIDLERRVVRVVAGDELEVPYDTLMVAAGWGFPGFLIWGVVHLAYLVGWGNRFGAVARWMWTILARNRRERLISVVSLAGEEAGRRQLHALRGAPRPARRETQPTV
jgi:NADH dehydrogenase FAD-containing subunit